jgi:hypothetical protein
MNAMKTTVQRYSFFDQVGQTLRFDEASPAPDHREHEHSVCNCTKTVSERPTGTPRHVSQLVRYEWTLGARDIRVEATDESINFTVRWKPDLQAIPTDDTWGIMRNPHAYFWFGGDDQLNVEITKAGEGRVDCFFGKMFLGNNVDTSELRNGHSPSAVVKRELLGEDTIWCYGGHWDTEAMAIFDTPEASEWLRLWRTINALRAEMSSVNQKDRSVDVVRQDAEAERFTSIIRKSMDWMVGILDRLETTELYSRCRSVAD